MEEVTKELVKEPKESLSTLKDSIELEYTEAVNITNILISNFASQCLNIGRNYNNLSQDDHDGLKIASEQLGRFVSQKLQELYSLKA